MSDVFESLERLANDPRASVNADEVRAMIGDSLRQDVARNAEQVVAYAQSSGREHPDLALLVLDSLADELSSQFSAELLLPEKAMRREIASPVTLTSLAELKPRWGVSIQALVFRAHQLGIIGDRQYRYLFEQISIRGWRTREPKNLDIAVEKPRTLRKIVELLPFGNNMPHLAAELRLSVENVRQILSGYDDMGDSNPTAKQPVSNKVIPLRSRRA